jgi:hypothetical protein
MDRTLGGIAADADRHGLEFATHVGAIPSIVVSLEASSTWSATAAVCP